MIGNTNLNGMKCPNCNVKYDGFNVFNDTGKEKIKCKECDFEIHSSYKLLYDLIRVVLSVGIYFLLVQPIFPVPENISEIFIIIISVIVISYVIGNRLSNLVIKLIVNAVVKKA